MPIVHAADPDEFYRESGVRWFLSRRTATTHASFFLQHLRPGMRVLDCGCGPATVTVGLAEAVAPGEVWGIDLSPVQVDTARGRVRDAHMSNVHVQLGNVTALPFDAGEFDAAFASNILEYLSSPLDGLKEMRRVLRTGGVVGVLDADVSTLRLAPDSWFTREFLSLFLPYREQDASPYYAPRLGALLRDAGFTGARLVAFTECLAPPVETRALAAGLVEILRSPSFVTFVTQRGLANAEQLDHLAEGARAWGEDPDALWVSTQFGATGFAG